MKICSQCLFFKNFLAWKRHIVLGLWQHLYTSKTTWHFFILRKRHVVLSEMTQPFLLHTTSRFCTYAKWHVIFSLRRQPILHEMTCHFCQKTNKMTCRLGCLLAAVWVVLTRFFDPLAHLSNPIRFQPSKSHFESFKMQSCHKSNYYMIHDLHFLIKSKFENPNWKL